MTSLNDSPEPRKVRTARAKRSIDAFWSGTAGTVTMAAVGVAAVFGVFVAFGAL